MRKINNKLKNESSALSFNDEDYSEYADNVFYKYVPWIVKSVKPQEDYTLLLKFNDGSTKIYDMLPLINQEDGGDATFVPLKNIRLFKKAYKEGDSVSWPGDISIAPEELYENSMNLQEYEDLLAEDDDYEF